MKRQTVTIEFQNEESFKGFDKKLSELPSLYKGVKVKNDPNKFTIYR